MIEQNIAASNLKSYKSNLERLIGTVAAFKAGLLLRAKYLFRKYRMYSLVYENLPKYMMLVTFFPTYSSFSRKRRSSPSNPDPPEDAADSEWTDVETRVSHKRRSGTSHTWSGWEFGVMLIAGWGVSNRDWFFCVFSVLRGSGDAGRISSWTWISASCSAQVSASLLCSWGIAFSFLITFKVNFFFPLTLLLSPLQVWGAYLLNTVRGAGLFHVGNWWQDKSIGDSKQNY